MNHLFNQHLLDLQLQISTLEAELDHKKCSNLQHIVTTQREIIDIENALIQLREEQYLIQLIEQMGVR